MKHLIIPNLRKKFYSKHFSDCCTLAKILGEGCSVLQGTPITYEGYDYIWHFFEDFPDYKIDPSKIKRVKPETLLWAKFFQDPPLFTPEMGTYRYDVGHTSLLENPRVLELLDSSKFTSASIGIDQKSRGIRGHYCKKPLAYPKVCDFLYSTKITLITQKGISNTLCEALYWNRPIAMDRQADLNRNLGFSWDKYVSRKEDLERLVKVYDKEEWIESQEKAKQFIKGKAYDMRFQFSKFKY